MNNEKYEDIILNKVKDSLDTIVSFSSVVLLICTIIDYIRDANSIFVYFDITSTILLIFVFLFKQKLTSKMKIIILAGISFIYGFLALFISGFYGIGFMVLVIGCTILFGYRSSNTATIVNTISIFLTFSLPILLSRNMIEFKVGKRLDLNSPVNWINHILILLICVFTIRSIMNSIKKSLTDSLKECEDQLIFIKKLAYYDQLTGLPNKNKLFADSKISINNTGWFVLFNLVDYDIIASIYGSTVLNGMMKAISEICVKKIRNNDIAARTGSNEFAFLFSNISQKELLDLLQSFVNEVNQHETILKMQRKFGFYFGYIKYDLSNIQIDEMYQKASIALQEARIKKEALPICYNDKMEKLLRKEDEIRSLLDYAFDNNEFYMCYQEKWDCLRNKVIGVEALIRWKSHKLGTLSPNIFLPIIEKSNYSTKLGNRSISLAFSDLHKLYNIYSEDINISINISPTYISSQGFFEFITSEVKKHGISPEKIVLEITEEILIDNMGSAIQIINELKDFGFKISLDDFGTGYTSLSYLSRLSFDELKIDKSFVDQLTTDSKSEKLIHTIINLKETYNCEIVVEGVETEEQYNILMKLGCNIIQGFYFSKPKQIE